MKKKLIVLSGFALSFVTPVVVLAQTINPGSGTSTFGTNANASCNAGNTATIFTLLCTIGQILNAVVPVLIALGVVYFIWGVVSYVIASDEEAKKAGRNRIIYGIIGLAVIIAVWGLVGILKNTFVPASTNTTFTVPTI